MKVLNYYHYGTVVAVLRVNSMKDEQSGFSGTEQTNLSHIKTDLSYCRAPTRNLECKGRLGVQKCEGFKRMDVEKGNLPKALLKPRQTRNRSLCIESVETTQKIHILENRPIRPGKGFISNNLI